MTNTITYKRALEKIAHVEKRSNALGKLDAFDRSLILAVLFGVDKEKALDDIIALRS